MKPFAYAVVLISTTLLLAGCSSGDDDDTRVFPAAEKTVDATDTPPPPSLPPPPPLPAPPASDSGGVESSAGPSEPNRPVEPPAAASSSPAAPQPATPRTPAGQPSIRLSAGVALPQTTPSGTVMSFSVDYRFIRGGPDPSAQYYWVVQRARGSPGRLPVRLAPSSTLRVFVRKWRVQDGPFQSHIEDGRGNRLCRSVALR